MENGFLVIESYNPNIWTSKANEYCGYDGYLWPEDDLIDYGKFSIKNDNVKLQFNIYNGVALPHDYNMVLEYYSILDSQKKYRLLYLEFGSKSSLSPFFLKEFSFLGFDLGSIDKFSSYSVLLNDIVLGVHDRMHYFKQYLNDKLLLPSIAVIENILQERKKLVQEGKDLEEIDGSVFSVAVYEVLPSKFISNPQP